MKFTTNRNLFIENLNNVMRAISSRATIPILSGIKLDLTETELTLTGSDTDISIEIKIPVNEDLNVESTGSIVLPARFFSEIVKKLPGKDFSFEVKESFQTQIVSENSEFTINGSFREIINETQFATSNDQTRAILTGVRFFFNPTNIKAVATDSHRLSQRTITLENGPQAETDLIIPGKSLQELARIIGETDPEVKICPGDNQALFVIGNLSFYSRLLDGNYPDTDRLIPTEKTTSVEFDISELSSALERASLLTHAGRNNVVTLTLDTTNQTAKLSGKSAEIGNVEEDVSFRNLEGNDLQISFNPDYMRDALRASITDSVVMSFTKPLRPFVINPDKDDIEFVQLITPVRTY